MLLPLSLVISVMIDAVVVVVVVFPPSLSRLGFGVVAGADGAASWYCN